MDRDSCGVGLGISTKLEGDSSSGINCNSDFIPNKNKERANSDTSSCASDGDTMCGNCFKIFSNPTLELLQQCENCLHFNKRNRNEENSSTDDNSNCFQVKSGEGCGRFLVATRDLLPGEVILLEKPLVVGPMMMECVSSLYPTCLGCCRVTNTSYSCSKCKWPVCGELCEKMTAHADFECKVFRKAKIPSLPHPQRYQMIQLLRCCMLQEISPKKFAQLMSLESHVEERRSIYLSQKPGKEKESKFSEQAFRFITEMCKLRYDYELIDYIIGVCWVNSFGADALLGYKKRRCSLIFHKLSMLNHDCIPNTCLVIFERRDEEKSLARGIGNIWGELRASVLIRAGEAISQQYVNVIQGTSERRAALVDNWYFSCFCARCADPTENQTFFSAVKCKKCSSGFLLPDNPLDSSSLWKCVGNLKNLTNSKEKLKTTLGNININDDVQKCDTSNTNVNSNNCEDIEDAQETKKCDSTIFAENIKNLTKEFSNVVLSFKDNIEKLEELLDTMSGKMFHPQHYLIQDIKYQIVEEFINISAHKLREIDEINLRNGLDFKQLAIRCVQYSRDLLRVSDRISPGETTYRGVLIYFLCYSIFCSLRKKTFSEAESEWNELEDLVKQGRIILLRKAEGSPYISMAERLKSFLPAH